MSAVSGNFPVNSITPQHEFMRLIPSKAAFRSSMLRRKDFLLDVNIIGKITDYFVEVKPQLAYWYKALEELDLLPELAPALPDNIHDVLDGPCPIVNGQKIFESHSLYLIPPNSLNDLENRVSAYGRIVLGAQDDENPLRFGDFYQRERFGNNASDHWEWALIPNTVVEKTRNICYAFQVFIVENLNQNSGTNYEIASLREMGSFLFLHKVATGVSLYEAANAQNGYRGTHARVQEADEYRDHLAIGGSDSSGVSIDNYAGSWPDSYTGIAVLRKFS